jgi:hypothetical protein
MEHWYQRAHRLSSPAGLRHQAMGCRFRIRLRALCTLGALPEHAIATSYSL